MVDELRLAAAARRFEEAALGRESWHVAVEAYAEALDLKHGQLIAFGRDSLVMLNISTGEALAELESFGGHAPEVNSRVRIGTTARELQFLDEQDFCTEEDARLNRQYGDWLERHAVGYSCVTPLLRHGGLMVGLAALRDRAQDEMNREEKRGFMTIATEARAAVTLAIAVEGQQAKSLASALERMACAALVLDGAGSLLAASRQGEQALDRLGRSGGGTFSPHRSEERDRFNAGLGQALQARQRADVTPPAPIVLTDVDGLPVVAEFVPLPPDTGFPFVAAVMVILRGAGGARADDAALAGELFGLTSAEARVAGLMLEGCSPQQIATRNRTTVGTVRNHVHRILSKAECRSQVEFLGLMRRYA